MTQHQQSSQPGRPQKALQEFASHHHSEKHPSTPKAAFCDYVHTLFEPSDVLEVRAIETWQGKQKKQSRLVDRAWLSPEKLVASYDYFAELNRTQLANIYIGVHPRTARFTDRVETIRCVWADIDGELPEVIVPRLPPVLPPPSMVVASGTGTHLYWMLSDSLDVSLPQVRRRFEQMLQQLYADIGGDCIQNIDRLLRLPGFQNQKDARNGRTSMPCMLTSSNESTYSVSAFDPWWPNQVEKHSRAGEVKSSQTLSGPKGNRTWRRIAGLLRYLDHDVPDRSKRDFACVCGLLRLGLDVEEIAALVARHSKFADNPKYLTRTIQKALDAVRGI